MNSEPQQENKAADPSDAEQIAEDLVDATIDTREPEEDTVESLRAKLGEMENLALRYQADLDNFRKRSRAQLDERLKYAPMPLLTELLESVDNLTRATESAQAEADGSALLQGVTMVANQLQALLDKNGCKVIQAVGQPFDPNCHQAVQMQPSEDHPANTVMHEIRSGYKLHDRVIRPAQVFVSTGPASENEE